MVSTFESAKLQKVRLEKEDADEKAHENDGLIENEVSISF